jgi:hypothetical protein
MNYPQIARATDFSLLKDQAILKAIWLHIIIFENIC